MGETDAEKVSIKERLLMECVHAVAFVVVVVGEVLIATGVIYALDTILNFFR